MSLGDILAAANAGLAATVVWKSWQIWQRVRDLSWGWIKLAQVIVGLAWVVVSLYLLITPEDAAQAEIGRIVARPVITMTLAIWAAGAIVGEKRA